MKFWTSWKPLTLIFISIAWSLIQLLKLAYRGQWFTESGLFNTKIIHFWSIFHIYTGFKNMMMLIKCHALMSVDSSTSFIKMKDSVQVWKIFFSYSDHGHFTQKLTPKISCDNPPTHKQPQSYCHLIVSI